MDTIVAKKTLKVLTYKEEHDFSVTCRAEARDSLPAFFRVDEA
jgi:hypothetical protein